MQEPIHTSAEREANRRLARLIDQRQQQGVNISPQTFAVLLAAGQWPIQPPVQPGKPQRRPPQPSRRDREDRRALALADEIGRATKEVLVETIRLTPDEADAFLQAVVERVGHNRQAGNGSNRPNP